MLIDIYCNYRLELQGHNFGTLTIYTVLTRHMFFLPANYGFQKIAKYDED